MSTVHRSLSTESSRLPLWFPVLVGCGIALYFAQAAPTPLWPYLIGLVAMAGVCVLAWRHSLFRLLALGAVALLLGTSASAIRMVVVEAPVLREPIFFKMVLGTIEDIQHKEKKTKLILRDVTVETLEKEQTPKRVSVTIKLNQTPQQVRGLSIGARIELPAMLFPPPAPAMPNAYDFARMFYFQQLGAVGFSPRQPEIIGSSFCSAPAGAESGSCSMPAHQQDDGWQKKLTALRLSISDHLVASMGNEMGAIASALMVGEQSRVPEEISESMRASGIYHILSISGLHMALATGMIFFVFRLLLAMIPHAALHWPNKKIAASFALLGGLAYLLLAGAPVPAIRSYIMVACVLGAILMDRKGISMFSLGWAATLILLFMPESLFTASFQLSFAATLAIVALYERYGHVFFHAHAGLLQRCLLYFFGLMLTSLAATFYTSPLAITHFNRMAIYGILANMLVVPLSSFIIMPAALIAFITMPFGLDAWPLSALKMGLEWMMVMSRFVSNFPYANITLPAPSAAGVLLIIAGGLWLTLWASRIRWLGLCMIVAGLSSIALFKPYDFIISDDAKRVAYRSADNQWVMIRGDVDSFEAEIWLRTQGEEVMLSRKEALGKIPELHCDKTSCMVERNGKTIVVAISSSRRKSGSSGKEELDTGVRRYDNFCESGAEVVITSQYYSCDNIPHLIDRGFVESHGASGLRFAGDVIEVETSEQQRGHWPWAQGKTDDRDDQTETP